MALDEQFAASIKDVKVTFGFSQFDCDPNEITAKLRVVPDDIRRCGEERRTPGGRPIIVPFSTWSVSSLPGSKDVNDLFRELFKRLDGCANRIESRWGVPGFSVVYRATHLSGGNGPFFEVDVVRGIASFGAELWQDIYALDDAPSERDAGTR